MRIATSTNIISSHHNQKRIPMVEFIGDLAEAGFTVLDLNFYEMMNPNSILLSDKYLDYVEKLKVLKEEHKLIYNQAHAPYTHNLFEIPKEEQEKLRKQINRSIEMAGLLKIPYIVLHGATDSTDWENSLEANIKWLRPFVELAQEVGVSIALENLAYDKNRRIEFTASVDNLVALIEAFDCPNVVACYDFGHANMISRNHKEDILKLGSHLKTLHVADNHGAADEHLLPFHGNVDWHECLKALASNDYKGDFTYEIMFFSENIPKEVQPQFLSYAYAVASYLVNKFNWFLEEHKTHTDS
ncbi:MAG: sugar phosphate isomerase/epimerase family protein [Sphaerochaetaceae bacterium]